MTRCAGWRGAVAGLAVGLLAAWSAPARAAEAAAAASASVPVPVSASAPAPAPLAGRTESLSIASARTGVVYPIRLYRSPAALATPAGSPPPPVIYLLDADWRLETLARPIEARGLAVVVAGIANEATRNHDDVPENRCIPGGGGEAAFFDFVRFELIPFVEARVAVDPARRALFGHSFGGAFTLRAMLDEAPGARHFRSYAALDPGVRCVGDALYGWEAAYAAAHDRLDARLHFSYANPVSLAFAERLASRRYAGFEMAVGAYAGGHDGMIPAAFADALAFLFP